MKNDTLQPSERLSVCHVEITNCNSMPRVWREAKSAHAEGFSVVVIGQGKSSEVGGIKYIGFEDARNRFYRVFVRSKRMIKAAIKTRANIIHVHSPELLLYLPLLKRHKKTVVFDSHEFYSYQIKSKNYIPRCLRSMVAFFYSAFEKYICRRVDCVLYPCTIEGKNYFEGRAKRSLKIENYSQPFEENLDPIGREASVIYAGSLTKERGISVLVDAIKAANCKLILCGEFSSIEYQKEILSSSSLIDYRGAVSREELFNLYKRSSIGLCTLLPLGQYAKLDNMSTKVYEYMECSLPVIMSDFPCYQKWNSKLDFGICVNPMSPQEIAASILFLFNNQELAHKLGENGRRAFEEIFNWNVEAKKLLGLYRELIDNHFSFIEK